MAKKQTNPVEQPPSEEKEHVSMEEEESEGEQDEPIKTPSSSPTIPAAGKKDSGSNSVSEIETKKVASVLKSKNKKKKKKKEARSFAAVVASLKKKKKARSIEEGSSRDANAKCLKTEEEKTFFKRVWSEGDEIVLLQAIIDLGTEPFKDKIRFEESVKSSISIEFTNSQLMQKIRRLKYKFQDKEKKEVITFLNPHDRKCFEMSKEIWGSNMEEDEEEEDTKNVVLVNGEDDWFDKSFIVGKVASFGVGEESVKQGWRLVPMERKVKIQEKMRLLETEGVRLALGKMDLVHEVASAIAEATR